jgi:RNA polymerase-binding protein DksA
MLTNEELKYFQDILLAKRHETQEELDELKELSKEKDPSTENAAYASHIAEMGTDAQEQEKTFLLTERLNDFLLHLNEALDRVVNKTYGSCQLCGKDIGKERLEAVPQTQLCMDCKIKMG